MSRNPKKSSTRLILLLASMVLVPLLMLGGIGTQLVKDQEAIARLEVERSYLEQLKSVDSTIQTIVRGFERELTRYALLLPETNEPNVLRRAVAGLPRPFMVLVLDEDGQVVFPPIGQKMPMEEQAFLKRSSSLWDRGSLEVLSAHYTNSIGEDRGWLSFTNEGAQYFIWWLGVSDRTVAIEISPVMFMTELITELPTNAPPVGGRTQDGPQSSFTINNRIVLSNPSGQTVYQWGNYEPRSGERPKATLALAEPLDAWTIRSYSSESPMPQTIVSSLELALWGGVLSLALVLLTASSMIWRSRRRENSLAAQRVSFVNQVSHELKTPLTNLSMYVDLMKQKVEELEADYDVSPMIRYLKVMNKETERLSQMIRNVLSYSRSQGSQFQIRQQRVVADEIVERVLMVFEPTLRASEITVQTELHAKRIICLDVDVFEQILINLVSNVQKYAKLGKRLHVSTDIRGSVLTLKVRDYGPGIPRKYWKKVFVPFWRLSDKLNEGVSGTGIGLDIAKKLAKLHGGDLVLDTTVSQGSRFVATFNVSRQSTERAVK